VPSRVAMSLSFVSVAAASEACSPDANDIFLDLGFLGVLREVRDVRGKEK